MKPLMKTAPVFVAAFLTYASPCVAGDNTVGGTAAGDGLTTGTNNTLLGTEAGISVTTGTDNTLLGYESGKGVTGSHNIILGEDPSSAITSGSTNILVGNSLTKVANTSSNQLDIGDTIFATLNNGAVGIGTASGPAGIDAVRLQVEDSSFASNLVVLNDGVTGTPPTYPTVASQTILPALTVDVSETIASRPLFFGYNTGSSSWGGFMTVGACDSYSYICLDMGSGTNIYTVAQSDGTTLNIGGGVSADGTFTNVDFYNTGAVVLAGGIPLQFSGSSSGYVGFQPPSAPTSITYTLPTAAPTAASGYVLSSTSSGTMSWIANGAGGGTALSAITAATGANTIASGTNAQVWEWALTGQTGFTFGESTVSTGASKLVDITTLATSTAVPLTITNGGASAFAINMSAGGLAIGGTNVIALPDADTSSIAVGENALKSQSATSEANSALGDLAGEYITSGAGTVAIGYEAMLGVSATPTTGHNNTGVGYEALIAAQGAAANNTAVGAGALSATTTGSDSTAIGMNTLFSATGTPNDALGYNAGAFISTGANNVALGYTAMQGVSATPLTGTYNTGVGNSALLKIQGAAEYNTALGGSALYDATTGNQNTAVGYDALASDTTGSNITALGYYALNITTGSPNTAVGANAGTNITSGTYNIAIGYQAMNGVSTTPVTGSDNVAVGDQALYSAQGAAAGNTALGYGAGYNGGTNALTTGTNNVYIGYGAHGSAATNTNEVVIGEGVTGNGSNTTTIGLAGTTTATYPAGQLVSKLYTLTDAATVTVNWNNGNVQYLLMTSGVGASRTINFTNGVAGGKYTLILKQDATGSQTVSWCASGCTIGWPGAGTNNTGNPVLTTTASHWDYISFVYSGIVANAWSGVSISQNFTD